MGLTSVESGHRYSQAVLAGQLVFLSRQVADDIKLDISGHTRQAWATVGRLLGGAGSRRDRPASVTVYLRDIADYSAMKTVRDAGLASDTKPVRASVQAHRARPEHRVEVQVTAAMLV
jgi:enamine deaminase RidA (YjgF/YER057c/UK114 family)